MKTLVKHLVVLAAFLFSLAAQSKALAQSETVQVNPAISFSVFYARTNVAIDKHEPVWLQLSIGNPQAINSQLESDALKQARETGLIDKTSPAQQSKPSVVPTVSLGSGNQSVLDLISFSIKEANGDFHPIVARALLPAAAYRAPVVLDGKTSVHLDFGVDPESISKLPNGKHEIKVSLDTRKKPGMWQGLVEGTVNVTVADNLNGLSPQSVQERQYEYGQFCLLSKQFDKVDKYAKQLLAVDPRSISAAELQGDAYLGKGQLDDAEKAYGQGLDRYNQKFGPKSNFKLPPNTVMELPEYLNQQMAKVLMLKRTKSNNSDH